MADAKSPRDLLSFGVAGLLASDCHIYYERLSSAQHVGRVSDLLSAKLRSGGLDELRLRALLLFGVFEGYRAQVRNDGKLAQPVVLECGIDRESVAVGISVTGGEGASLTAVGLDARITARTPAGPLEALLCDLHGYSDELVIRLQPDARRAEVVALLRLGASPATLSQRSAAPVQVIALTAATAKPARKSGSYTELGDLDHARLLNEEKFREAQGGLTDEATVIAGSAPEAESVHRIHGESAGAELKTVISGGTERIGDPNVFIVKGDAQAAGSAPSDWAEQLKGYQEKIADLELKLAELQNPPPVGSTIPVQSKTGGIFPSLIGKIWPFRRKKQEDLTVAAGASAASEAEAKVDATLTDAATLEAQGARQEPAENATATARTLMIELQAGGLDRALSRANREAADIKKLGGPRASRWVDGLMGELVTEKSRLNELAKRLNLSLRQKELQFRNRETGLLEEIRRRDELLRQKENAVVRLKDQVSEMTMTVERQKASGKGTNEASAFKQRYALVQKMLAAVKTENAQLTSRVEELRSQLSAAQHSKSTNVAAMTELTAIRGKYERVVRAQDELKKQNRDLAEKLAEARHEGKIAGGGLEELKHKFDLVQKQLGMANAETERQRALAEELQKELARLKGQGGNPKAA